MQDLERIETFIRVVEAGSFSAAARESSSISSVARQVKSLEEELGIRLLNRTTRSLSPTEAGMNFYERCRAVANDLSNAKSEAQSFQADVKGVLRVSLRVSVGTYVILPALPELLKRYPGLSLDIELTDERRDLISNNIDLAIWMGHLPDSEYVARHLAENDRVVCCSPLYSDTYGIPQTPECLRDHNCLLYTANSYERRWRFTREGKHQDVDVTGSLRSANGVVLLSAALAGVGLIVANRWVAKSPISDGRLIPVLTDYVVNPKPGDASLYAVYASNRGLSSKVRVFVDFLLELFDRQGIDEIAARGQAAPQ